MSSKENNFKEQFKQALISTAKVISEDYKLDVKKLDKDLSNKKTDFFDITNLSNKNDFVRLRAETDSGALKKKFSNKEIFNKNLPNNPSCKSLYNIAEKIRYELLGGKMLKGVGKNLSENYSQKILSNHKEQLKLKSKENIQFFKRLKRIKPKVLDKLIHPAHEEVFECTDCLKCANCCSTTSPLFTDKDIARIAKHLRIKRLYNNFVKAFIFTKFVKSYIV